MKTVRQRLLNWQAKLTFCLDSSLQVFINFAMGKVGQDAQGDGEASDVDSPDGEMQWNETSRLE